ncbi:hypothetical protein FZW96_08005 [Bacillus sp. BGMRC 2118]|nr:hypothetical protein FZW96_08005 [Bacillus sp. BGMRC 2118]
MLNETTYRSIYENMKTTWDINSPVWYPLYSTKRSDVLSFNLNDDPVLINEFRGVLIRILVSYEVDNIYKLGEQELGFVPEIICLSELAFTNQDFIGDSFWCNHSLEWIIYACHDGYITIGGSKFICDVKESWASWGDYKAF